MSSFKFIILVIAILLIGCIVLFFISLLENRKIKSLKNTVNSVIDANNYLHNELKRRDSVDKIKSDNRKESNEKINDLYNGDSFNNAINILCNNKKN